MDKNKKKELMPRKIEAREINIDNLKIRQNPSVNDPDRPYNQDYFTFSSETGAINLSSGTTEKQELVELIELAENLNRQIKDIKDSITSSKFRMLILGVLLYSTVFAVFLVFKKTLLFDDFIQGMFALFLTLFASFFIRYFTITMQENRNLRERMHILKKSSNELNARAYNLFEIVEGRMSIIERESLRIRINLLNTYS